MSLPGVAPPAPRSLPLFALGLLLVLAFAAHLRLRAATETIVSPSLQGDSVHYVSTAYNLHRFGVVSRDNTWSRPDAPEPVPDARSPPGFPALLALVMDQAPDQAFLRRALWMQALLGVLGVLAGTLLARMLLRPGPALAVGALLAISPQLVSLGTSLLTETTYALAVAGFALALVAAARTGRTAWYGVAGVLLGACALVRPTLMYLPVALLPAIVYLADRARWQAAGALLLGFLLAFGPWLVRNERVLGQASDPTLVTGTLLHGSYPDFQWAGRAETTGVPYRFDPGAKQIRTPGLALARIGANLQADPAGTLRWYLIGKPIRLHDWGFVDGGGDIFVNVIRDSPYLHRPTFRMTYLGMRLAHVPLMLLGALGLGLALLRLARRDRSPQARAWSLLAVTLAFAIAVHMAGMPLARYAVPFRVLTFLFAAHAVVELVAFARRRRPA
ncbi:MAG: glycosyltransferase family 39 protein [Arenimonas sp.]